MVEKYPAKKKLSLKIPVKDRFSAKNGGSANCKACNEIPTVTVTVRNRFGMPMTKERLLCYKRTYRIVGCWYWNPYADA